MFKASKMGLLNFWFYDLEEFEFYDGKLLLRGQNGSGKSVTMQSFIPLILDGNKSPKRLDTFGSMDKHIEYYLLGDKNEKEDSTGYLYMEFFQKEEERYITIGMGLRARVGKPTEFWGFALKDGKRMNEDFFLYKCTDGLHKTPMTKLELKAALGPNNCFVETTKEYKKMVNDLLFGFPNVDSYDEFINVLLQIRSPKLSKDYKPSKLMSIMNEVLPPLAEEDLRPLSDTIENLNQTKEKMDQLADKIKLLGNFIKVFHHYNEVVLVNKSETYLKNVQAFESKKEEHQNTLQKITEFRDLLNDLEEKQNQLQEEYQEAMVSKEAIEDQDLVRQEKRKYEIECSLDGLTNQILKQEDLLSELKQKMASIQGEVNQLEGELYSLEQEIVDAFKEILDDFLTLGLADLGQMIDNNNKEDFPFSYAIEKILDKKKEILTVKGFLEEKERILKMQDEKQQEYDGLKKKYEQKQKEKGEVTLNIENELELLLKFIQELGTKNEVCPLYSEDIKAIVRYLDEYTKDNYSMAKKSYEDFIDQKRVSLMNELMDYEHKEKELKHEKEVWEEQLTVLETQEESLLKEQDWQEGIQEFLETKKIRNLPFYQAVDFQDGISDEVANEVEELLLSSGILSSYFLLEKDIEKVAGQNISYLVKSSKKKKNLSQYLKPVKNDVIPSQTIQEILESISLSKEDSVYLSDQMFQMDFLKGTVSRQYESKYIGILKRKKRHEEEVESVLKEINELDVKLKSILALKNSVTEKLKRLKVEKDWFPNDTVLQQLEQQYHSLELEVQFLFEKENQVEEKIREYQNQLETLLRKLETKRSNIPLNLSSYQEASYLVEASLQRMYALENKVKLLVSRKELMQNKKVHLEDVVTRYDESVSYLADFKEQQKAFTSELEAILAVLNTKEYQSIKEKLQTLTKIIESYPDKKSEFSRNIGSNKEKLEQFVSNSLLEEQELEQIKIYVHVSEELLKEELELGYIKHLDVLDCKNVKQLIKEIGIEGRDLSSAQANYYKAYNEYRQELIDYGILDMELFGDREAILAMYADKVQDIDGLRDLYMAAKRRDIVTIYQGKKMNLYSLEQSLREAYGADQIYLNEQDRHLFEDILLRTVGGKIKEKIIDAQDWVKKINQIMADKQENSNLAFYLEWKARSKDTFDEMDTKELVELFRKPSDSVLPSDTERLIKHFRSKIKSAEEYMDGKVDSYFQMIFDILDYRTWFEFKLFYKKDGNEKRELTDKVFSVFSGGEKAKTMYVPLFASVSSKLDSALPCAPRLIALDEAFAGVDDQNIAEMFGILNQFKLDYLLTSQALWCDYPEIQDISICELIRPMNQTSVAVKRCRWNGKSMEILLR